MFVACHDVDQNTAHDEMSLKYNELKNILDYIAKSLNMDVEDGKLISYHETSEALIIKWNHMVQDLQQQNSEVSRLTSYIEELVQLSEQKTVQIKEHIEKIIDLDSKYGTLEIDKLNAISRLDVCVTELKEARQSISNFETDCPIGKVAEMESAINYLDEDKQKLFVEYNNLDRRLSESQHLSEKIIHQKQIDYDILLAEYDKAQLIAANCDSNIIKGIHEANAKAIQTLTNKHVMDTASLHKDIRKSEENYNKIREDNIK